MCVRYSNVHIYVSDMISESCYYFIHIYVCSELCSYTCFFTVDARKKQNELFGVKKNVRKIKTTEKYVNAITSSSSSKILSTVFSFNGWFARAFSKMLAYRHIHLADIVVVCRWYDVFCCLLLLLYCVLLLFNTHTRVLWWFGIWNEMLISIMRV